MRMFKSALASGILPLLAVMPVQLDGQEAAYDRAKDPHQFTVFMKEGGWCWFQDPRAIVHDGTLFIGSIQGNGSGDALVGVYDLRQNKARGTVTMHEGFDRDDHNSPVFHLRPDGGVLAVYAKHHIDRFHYSRVSSPSDPLKWSKETRHERAMPNPSDRVTYMNLHELRNEGELLLLFRGIDFNPTLVKSSDHGLTWSDPLHFIGSEIKGRHRPYARYADNGADTLHMSFTDAHPRDFGNSIYYAAYRDGYFVRADGTKIKSLVDAGPLLPSEAERVYAGSGAKGRGHSLSAPGAAWTSSIAFDADGHPHIAYTLYLGNKDNRFRLASWNGKEWIDREVAHAGKCLYDRESSYTGLITMDPADPEQVFLSTDVDPTTGADSGGNHEIYRAKVGAHESIRTIVWRPVTKSSPVRNLRPMVLRDGAQRIVLWNRGDFRTYVDYQLDTVGFVEPASP